MGLSARIQALPVAVLEEHGLPVKLINTIEEQFDAIYIRELGSVTRRQFLEGTNVGKKGLLMYLKSLEKAKKAFGE